MTVKPVSLPAHGWLKQPWRSESGPVEDRQFTSFEARLPPLIAAEDIQLPPDLIEESEKALDEAVRLDAEYGARLRPLAGMMLRTEVIATSNIEGESASTEDYIRALHGNRSNRSAMAMARATEAIDHMVAGGVDEDTLLEAHVKLMGGQNPFTQNGQYRTVQNWIGGSDHSPRDALHVPPPPAEVKPRMTDLFAFCRRRDLPAIPQAAIAHAQFENIHPFIDGNGRTGRALIAALLRERRHTRHTTIPIAAALAARRQAYFATLWAYRDQGDARPIISTIAQATRVTSQEARVTAHRLEMMPQQWRETVRPRRGSTADALFAGLAENPLLSTADVERLTGTSGRSAERAVNSLEEAMVIREITGRRRDRLWVASAVIDEIDGLGHRIHQRMTE